MNQHIRLPLVPSDQVAIERIVSGVLQGRSVEVRLFGSRARGDQRLASDIDLAVSAAPAISAAELALIREALEESCIPYRVDVLDYATAPESLRKAIDQEGLTWHVPTSA